MTILLFHPGRHDRACGGVRRWRRCADGHRRAFLVADGTAVSGSQRSTLKRKRGRLAFWGEWEADAIVWPLPNALSKALPNGYLEPRLQRRTTYTALQNTDPLVLGGPFVWSICGQPSYVGLRSLERGDVVLFGSQLSGDFVLDTVLVIAERFTYHLPNWRSGIPRRVRRKSVEIATLGPLAALSPATCTNAGPFSLYVGATPDDPVDGRFSFVPGQLIQGTPTAFKRPVIYRTRQTQGVSYQAPLGWEEVVDIVLSANLVLGTQLDEPPLVPNHPQPSP